MFSTLWLFSSLTVDTELGSFSDNSDEGNSHKDDKLTVSPSMEDGECESFASGSDLHIQHLLVD